MAKPEVQSGRGAQKEAPIVVEPRWLLKAGLLVMLVALVCGYVTLCGLFYQGQWQFVLHPVRTAERPATIGGAPYDLLRFGPDSSGLPQRTAWWIPPGDADRYRHLVVLYLPSGDGSLKDATPVLDGLRRLGLAVFAVSYRGYGESADVHPNEGMMRDDAEAAWSYLTRERGVSGQDVIPYGAGVGASLAMRLAQSHGEIAAVVLDAPQLAVVARVKADPRVRFLPVEWLLHDRFAMEPALAESKVPKLILSNAAVEEGEIARAGEPKMTVEMPTFQEALFDQAVRRFLDAYAPPTPPVRLVPNGAPQTAR